MITNFEKFTDELNDKERSEILPILIKVLQVRIGKDRAITNKQIVSNLEVKCGIKTTGPRIRKVINYIRMTGAVERLIATSKGYYVSNDAQELLEYETSLIQRAESIEAIARQIKNQRLSA